MNIKTDFEDGEVIPEKYTWDGDDVNPKLELFEIPMEAKSLALIMSDPDAKRVCGHTWIHWAVFNISTDAESLVIDEDSVPGIEVKNSSGQKEYSGPRPPPGSGVHEYYFSVYALDSVLDENISSVEELEDEINNHKIDFSEIVGKYTRDQ